jgi:hypothetical protein
MIPESTPPRKLYTVEEANAALPLVKAITTDLVRVSRGVVERRQRVAQLVAGRRLEKGDPYAEELLWAQEQLQQEIDRVGEYLGELRELGLETKNATEGVVDFPSKVYGRSVFLCWKLGEPEVAYWHDLDGGYTGRQPLAADLVASGEAGSR